jgi:hypothetical protein
MSIKILNAGLEEDSDTKEIIIRGVVDQNDIRFIGMAWYQREQGFSENHINEIMAGLFQSGRVADITLGMRGHRVDSKGSTYTLQDKCFCIDGGQRLYAAAAAMKARPSLKLSIGAKIYLGTTEESENELFCKLGTTAVRISASLLMRNQKKKSVGCNLLVSLNRDQDFAMKERIAWDQVKTRNELMNGFTLARITGAMHAHKGGALRCTKVAELITGLDGLAAMIGEDLMRQNIIRFFDAIDKCWNIRNLSGGRDESRPHLRPEFLMTIATVMSRYPDFWNDTPCNEFYCGDKFVKRLRGFKLADYVRPASTTPTKALFHILRERLRLDPIFEHETETKEAAE